jgi:hypothetical protein
MNEKFEQLLDDNYQWPAPYLFKFVLPKEHLPKLQAIFDEYSNFNTDLVTLRPSRTGKYISFSVEQEMESTQAVIGLYQKTSSIDNIVSI